MWAGKRADCRPGPFRLQAATVSSQRDHVDTEGDCAEVETVGESTDVSEGAREGGTGYSAEEKDG